MTVAFRGGSKIEDKIALRAHLANLLRLENVGMLLGAGASVSAGGKVVKDLWDAFVEEYAKSAEWLADEGLVSAEDADIKGTSTPNIEQLADRLGIALAEWARVKDDKLDAGNAVKADLHRAVVKAAILSEAWWESVSGVGYDDDGLRDHRTILQKMTAARQPGQASPWIFTTNYDLAIEWAAESIGMSVSNGFIGTHARRFSPQSFDLGFRNTQARGEARFGVYNVYLAKLHGSLTWREHDDGFYEEQAAGAWHGIKAFLENDEEELGALVLPSAAKYMQTIGFVLGELLRRFAEFLARPQSCLVIVGYGFGDEHINRLLSSALLNPTLQLVIYLPEFVGLDAQEDLPVAVRRLLSLDSPRVTIVGGGAEAYLHALANDLPEPTIYDEDLRDLERRLREPEERRDEVGLPE
ncbi:SIR2 family anti-phage-associated protein [Xanthomonas sp. NCPPB 2632]|uniref:SIR2 family anti-phage-associated protein n=1 Tax=Xanthomonas sp. NCPPB 2632 TaxID=3240912 RepID=UPI0035171906